MSKIIGMMIFLCSPLVYSGGFKSENELRQFSDSLIEQMVAEEFQEGLDRAKPHWPIPIVEIDGIVNKINQQWPLVRQRFGAVIGAEFVKEERIGQSFVRYFYLHKFQKHAIYWKISFYKPEEEWKINTLTFLDSLDALYK